MAKGRRMRKKRGAVRRGLLIVLCLAVLALGAAAALRSSGVLSSVLPEAETETETVTVGGQEVEIDRSLPQSELEQSSFTTQEDGTVRYSGQAKYGIDVSAHQGEIDWAAVAADGVEFAFLRIGYRGYSAGALNQDERFAENLSGAQAQGIEVGIYFFSQAISEEEAREEAQQVLTWLEGTGLEGCWVAYDWEHIEQTDGSEAARTDDVTGETVTACAKAFCEEIAAGGYAPMLYCNGMLGYLSYDLTQLTELPLWYAEYGEYPTYAYEVTIWQYSESGTVNGISGKVDRNIWFLEESGGEDGGGS